MSGDAKPGKLRELLIGCDPENARKTLRLCNLLREAQEIIKRDELEEHFKADDWLARAEALLAGTPKETVN